MVLYNGFVKNTTILSCRLLIISSLLIITLTASLAYTTFVTRPARVSQRISFKGGLWFLAGYNYPWNHYSYDFSGNSSNIHEEYTTVNDHFADLAANGVRVTRWFVFCDLAQNPLFDDQGHVKGLSEGFFQAFDDALAIARTNHIYLIPDLIDSTVLLNKGNKVAQLRSAIFTDPTIRQSFFDRAVKPILQRYGQDANILAWSPINEPDYVTTGVNANPDSIGIPYQSMKDFMRQFTRYVHTYTHQMVTIENGPLHFTHQWMNLGFDFYSPHYYDWMASHWPDSDPVTNTAASFNLDKPIVLGELPTASSKYSVPQLLDALYNNGYAGALFWSRNVHDDVSNYSGTNTIFNTWVHAHSTDVNIYPN